MKRSKKEFEELFNKIFGVNVKWSKLSMDELVQIATVLANPDSLIKRLQEISGTSSGEREFIEGVRKILAAINYRGPIVDLLRKVLGVGVEERKE